MSLKIEQQITTECELYQAVKTNPAINRIVTLYLGAYANVDFVSTLIELDNQRTESIKKYSKLNPSDLLVGEAGLTGICLAYGLECASWVEKHAASPEIPSLMPGRPSEKIRHLEKLLLLSIFQTIPRNTSSKVPRIPQNKPLLVKIIDHFANLQRRCTGIVMEASLPGPTPYEHEPLPNLLAKFAKQSHTEKDHYLLILSGEKAIYDWHVVYINPALGVIADGGTGLLWKIQTKAHLYFHAVLNEFMGLQGYTDTASLIHVKTGPRTSCTPLFASRVGRRLQTAWCVARHSGVGAAFGYLKEIHRERRIVRYLFPPPPEPLSLQQEVMQTLCSLLKRKSCDELVPFVKKNVEVIRKATVMEFCAGVSFWGLTAEQLKNPDFTGKFLKALKQLDALKLDTFVSYILWQIINKFPLDDFKENFPEHLLKVFLPELSKLRKKCSVKFSARSIIRLGTLNEITFPFFATLIEHDPNAFLASKEAFSQFLKEPLTLKV